MSDINGDDINKMWDIHLNAALGNKISDEDKAFHDLHFDAMREQIKDDYEDWFHHAEKFNAKD